MIDTDKYEGHTPAPWVVKKGERMRVWHQKNEMTSTLICSIQATHCEPQDADAQLIADAPLLLEEVKRLRELLYKCWKDSGQSLHYLQVELLNDQEYWYEQMICDDDSKRCGDYGIEDCECDEE
tara:strand:+ start:95 stop:466 length:372 start_codon:yes stop_codon:yes gene_type:complete